MFLYNYLETTHTIRASITTYNSKGGNMSLLNNDEIPLGLGMALAQNMDAMRVFSSLSESSRQNVIDRSRQVNSKQEMEHLVAGLTEDKKSEGFIF